MYKPVVLGMCILHLKVDFLSSLFVAFGCITVIVISILRILQLAVTFHAFGVHSEPWMLG